VEGEEGGGDLRSRGIERSQLRAARFQGLSGGCGYEKRDNNEDSYHEGEP